LDLPQRSQTVATDPALHGVERPLQTKDWHSHTVTTVTTLEPLC
jgi:hypothetical protein